MQGHEVGTKDNEEQSRNTPSRQRCEHSETGEPGAFEHEPRRLFFTTPEGAPIDTSNFHKREWLPILTAKKIRPRPFYNSSQPYELSYSIGARSGFISSQTGDSIKIKILEADYAKYIEEASSNRDFVEDQIEKNATQVKPASEVDHSPPHQK